MQKTDQAFDADVSRVLKRLPDAFRFAPPGTFVQKVVLTTRGVSEGIGLRLKASRAGRTLHLYYGAFGGPDRTDRVAKAVVKACGMTCERTWPKSGIQPGTPNSQNTSGACNIQFVWHSARRSSFSLTVKAYIGIASSTEGQRSWSVRKHGLEGALDQAIALRKAAGYTVDRDLLLARLSAMAAEGPPAR